MPALAPLLPLDQLNPARFDAPAILKRLASSSRALAELKGIAASIPNQGILINTLGLQEASLAHPDHENCVLLTTVFNKSKRKCVISKVKVFDGKGAEIDVDWADTIDALGNPQDRAQLIGVVDKAVVCVRRRDGLAFREALVHITHSFDTKALVLAYEMAPGWQEYFAKG